MGPVPRAYCLLLLPLLAGLAHGAAADPVPCMARDDRQRLQRAYDDLLARFDLETATRRFIDINDEIYDLKAALAACRAEETKAGPASCADIAGRYDAALAQRAPAQALLGTAIDMREYLLLLQLRLERPLCGE